MLFITVVLFISYIVMSYEHDETSMLSIIGPFQDAFLYGKQILGGFLITNQRIDSKKRERKPDVVLKE